MDNPWIVHSMDNPWIVHSMDNLPLSMEDIDIYSMRYCKFLPSCAPVWTRNILPDFRCYRDTDSGLLYWG